jgi:hypothetical protein
MQLEEYTCQHPTIAGKPCAICATHFADKAAFARAATEPNPNRRKPMTSGESFQSLFAKSVEQAKASAETRTMDIENNGLYWHAKFITAKQELEHERYNVEKTAQEGARRLKDAEAREDTYYRAARESHAALREAREQLIRLRDGGAEHPDTQRIIDKIWALTNFDGYPKPIDQWGDGVAECSDWKDT